MTNLLPFGPARTPMARTTDPEPSHAAADVVRPHLGKIQQEVLAAYALHGPMSARQAERLPEFSNYGFSTIRKRISELHREGYLVECGTDTDGRTPCAVYRRVEP